MVDELEQFADDDHDNRRDRILVQVIKSLNGVRGDLSDLSKGVMSLRKDQSVIHERGCVVGEGRALDLKDRIDMKTRAVEKASEEMIARIYIRIEELRQETPTKSDLKGQKETIAELKKDMKEHKTFTYKFGVYVAASLAAILAYFKS